MGPLGLLLGGAAISAGGNLVSTGINAGMTAYQNRKQRQFDAQQAQLERDFNANQADLSRQFNAAEAQKNRDYQTEMANTAYQRGAKDMTAAGLNPALMYGGHAAATPSGSAASGGSASAGSGARWHGSSYAQSAAQLSGAFGAVGDALTKYGLAMSAKQQARDLLKDYNAISPSDKRILQELLYV